jgi:hypothetical protein
MFLHYNQDHLQVCHFFRKYGHCRAHEYSFKQNTEDNKEDSM